MSLISHRLFITTAFGNMARQCFTKPAAQSTTALLQKNNSIMTTNLPLIRHQQEAGGVGTLSTAVITRFITNNSLSRWLGGWTTTASAFSSSLITASSSSSWRSSLLVNLSVWFIKRTFQPSLMKRKRRLGFLVRQRTVGGRKILKRRRAKGRARLDGGI